MPKYRVLAKSFINNTIVVEGDVVDFDGNPGSNLEPYEPGQKPRRHDASASEPDVTPDIEAEMLEDHLT